MVGRGAGLVPAALLFGFGLLALSNAAPASEPRQVVDLAGRAVVVPARVERVGCLAATSLEKVLLLRRGSAVVVAEPAHAPWPARLVGVNAKTVAPAHLGQPNVEELLRLRPDVLFFRNDPAQLRRLTESGLNPAVTLAFGGRHGGQVATVEQFLRVVRAEVALYGDILGGDAPARAADWLDYFDHTVRLVAGRVADIAPDHRPKVYGLMGPGSTHSYGQYENSPWYATIAGGRMVTAAIADSGGIDVSMEQILLWNPDVVYIGHAYGGAPGRYGPSLITADPRWRDISAVHSGRVAVLPAGIDYWDRDSEGVLLLLFFAKLFYPDRFSDIDLAAEVARYYQRFYGVTLDRDEVAEILGQAPHTKSR